MSLVGYKLLVVVSNPEWIPDCNLESRAVMIEDCRVPIGIAGIPNVNVAKHPGSGGWEKSKRIEGGAATDGSVIDSMELCKGFAKK